jgi:hypothetical protein
MKNIKLIIIYCKTNTSILERVSEPPPHGSKTDSMSVIFFTIKIKIQSNERGCPLVNEFDFAQPLSIKSFWILA